MSFKSKLSSFNVYLILVGSNFGSFGAFCQTFIDQTSAIDSFYRAFLIKIERFDFNFKKYLMFLAFIWGVLGPMI